MYATQTVTARNIVFPVYSGKTQAQRRADDPVPFQPINMTPVWNNWFVTQNISTIRENICKAWTYIMEHIAVDETPGISLSLAAESSAIMRPGMLLYANKQVGYDSARPLAGGYAIRPTNVPPTQKLAPDSPYNITIVGINGENVVQQTQQHMAEFNTAALSPWHIPPTGIVECSPVTESLATITNVVAPSPGMCSELYSIPVASTLKRLAAFTGLITTTQQTYPFPTPQGMAASIKILAQASFANTVSMLLSGDVPTRDWAGYNDLMGKMSRSTEMSHYKELLTGGVLKHAVQLDINTKL